MKVILKPRHENNSYILTNKYAFFYRQCNGEFPHKWSGLWSNKNKYLDYIALKYNDSWLEKSKQTDSSFTPNKADHNYGEVKEEIELVNNNLIITLTSESKGVIELEAGINIRNKTENWHERDYTTKKISNGVLITSEAGFVSITSKGLKIRGVETYKDHWPSNEKQRCFIPGILEIPHNNKTEIIISFGEEKLIKLNNNKINTEFESNQEWLTNAYIWNAHSLYGLVKKFKNNEGIIAGLPWFLDVWTRDASLAIPAYLDLGLDSSVKNTLNMIGRKQLRTGKYRGMMPGKIISTTGQPVYDSIDATPLWLISLYNYIRYTGDTKFMNENTERIEACLEWVESVDEHESGFLDHEDGSSNNFTTWMDTLKRGRNAFEVQVQWWKALKSLSELGVIEKEMPDALKKKINNKFWNDRIGIYTDHIKQNNEQDLTFSANTIFGPYYFLSEPERTNRIINRLMEKDYLSKKGLRSTASSDASYKSEGYHTGKIWTHLTGMLAKVALNSNINGIEILRNMSEMLEDDTLGRMPENYEGEKLTPAGCSMQTWGSASFIHAVDAGILGIHPKMHKNEIVLNPSIQKGMNIKTMKSLGKEKVLFTMNNDEKGLSIKIKGLKGKELVIKTPQKYELMMFNNKERRVMQDKELILAKVKLTGQDEVILK